MEERMGRFRLEIQGNDLYIYRDEVLILSGQFDPHADPPRITQEANGWRIEHTDLRDIQDTFDLSASGHWFGGQELINQLWPLERIMLNAAPFASSDNAPDGLSGVQAPLWLASSGAALLADHGQALRIGFNRSSAYDSTEGSVALPYRGTMAESEDWIPFHRRPPPDDGTGDGCLRLGGWGLTYHLIVGENMVEARRRCLPHFGRPRTVPPKTLWHTPIWTTWARFKTDISQPRVLEFAGEIISHAYPHGVMEIDDRWQTHYGDTSFDPARFPDPRAMVTELHSRGFSVTCWVMPFIQKEAESYPLALERSYLLRQEDGSPKPVRWWRGSGFLIDVREAVARQWFQNNLMLLQKETGVDGFKFDAGEALFASGSNEYTRSYVDLASQFPLSEVRCAWANQRAPILFRQWDKASTWGFDNGLKSVITGALAMGLGGYPFVLPDMVGGNAERGENPDAELMVRWTQASALFPAIQFSLAPWDYGEECDHLCREALKIREHCLDRIAAAMQGAVKTGDPVIRPMWWAAPEDERALICDDEYLVGDDLLVAPVVEPGQRTRDVYLPHGTWRERQTAKAFVDGPTVLSAVPAPLDTLLVYVRI